MNKERSEDLTDTEKISDESSQTENNNKDEVKSEEVIDPKDKEIEDLRKALSEANDNLLRVKADADNFRKRITKDFEEKLKYANQSLLMDFITFADNIDIALAHLQSAEEPSIDKIKEGFELILKQFKDILAKHGMKEICCEVGEQFDPNKHEALMLDSRDDMDNNTITMVLQKGYTLNDRVVRPTKVKVNKK